VGCWSLHSPSLLRFRCKQCHEASFGKKRRLEALFRFGIVAELNGIGHRDNPRQCLSATLYPKSHLRYGDDMPPTEHPSALRSREVAPAAPDPLTITDISTRKPPHRASAYSPLASDPLLTVDDVARRLNVSKDWVWDHSSRKTPRLPVIRMGDGTLRYRASAIEDFISERERLSSLRSGRR
jgi:predicted DNA-binding transcriptional regulator AlpA